MEIAGLAVTIPAVVKELGALIDICKKFHDAPKELTRIQSQLLILNAQLQVIEHIERTTYPAQNATLPPNILQACKRTLDCAKHTISGIKDAIESQRVDGIRARLHFAFVGQAKAKQLLENLRNTETSVIMLFSLLSHYQSRTHDTLQDLVSMMLDLSRDVACLKGPLPYNNQHQDSEERSANEWIPKNAKGSPRDVVFSQARHYGDSTHTRPSMLQMSLGTSWSEEQTTRLLSVRSLLPFRWLLGQRAFVLDFAFRSYTACTLGFSLLSGSWIGVTNIIPDDAEIMKASLRGDLITVRELFRTGRAKASDSTIEFNYNPLTNAVASGNVELVEFLLRNGANVNGLFGRRQTSPLAWALRYRHEEVVRLLLERGADVNHVSAIGWTPMFYLWTETKPQTKPSLTFLKMMTAKNAFYPFDCDLTDVAGWDILHRAAAFGTPEDVRTLIALGARKHTLVGELNWKPIQQAVFFNNLPTLIELLPHYPGLDINSPDERGWTFLHIAASAGNSDIVRHLLKLGADPFRRSKPSWSHMPETLYGQGWTPAEVARAQNQERYELYMDALDEFAFVSNAGEHQHFSDALEYQFG